MRYLAIALLVMPGCYFVPRANAPRRKGEVGRQTRPVLSFQNLFLARQIALNEKFRAQEAGIFVPQKSSGLFDDSLEQMGAAMRLLGINNSGGGRKMQEEERRRLLVAHSETTYEKATRQLQKQYDAQRDQELLDARQDQELLDILRDRELFDVLHREVTTDDLQDVF